MAKICLAKALEIFEKVITYQCVMKNLSTATGKIF